MTEAASSYSRTGEDGEYCGAPKLDRRSISGGPLSGAASTRKLLLPAMGDMAGAIAREVATRSRRVWVARWPGGRWPVAEVAGGGWCEQSRQPARWCQIGTIT